MLTQQYFPVGRVVTIEAVLVVVVVVDLILPRLDPGGDHY